VWKTLQKGAGPAPGGCLKKGCKREKRLTKNVRLRNEVSSPRKKRDKTAASEGASTEGKPDGAKVGGSWEKATKKRGLYRGTGEVSKTRGEAEEKTKPVLGRTSK